MLKHKVAICCIFFPVRIGPDLPPKKANKWKTHEVCRTCCRYCGPLPAWIWHIVTPGKMPKLMGRMEGIIHQGTRGVKVTISYEIQLQMLCTLCMFIPMYVYIYICIHMYMYICHSWCIYIYIYMFVMFVLFLHTELQQFTISINTCGYSDMYMHTDMWYVDVCMCIKCTRFDVCVHWDIRTKISIRILWQNQYVYTHSSESIYVSIFTHIYLFFIYSHLCTYIYVYVHLCIFIFIFIYCIHTIIYTTHIMLPWLKWWMKQVSLKRQTSKVACQWGLPW